jgi:hypothetical protein
MPITIMACRQEEEIAGLAIEHVSTCLSASHCNCLPLLLHCPTRRNRRLDDRHGIFFTLIVLGIGNLYLRLHSLPERMAHKSQKLQFEIVAVLGLLALFTHIHLFWIAALLLALIDLPDFGTHCAASPRRSRR